MSAIELKAVNHFEDLFLSTKRLKPEIPRDDKGIITDGKVCVFQNEYNQQGDHSLADDNFIAWLKVQVKGKTLPKTKGYLTSFELNRDELQNIAKVGGLVLFVAGLPRDERGEKIPYFADLSLPNVELFLRQMGRNHARFSVPLQSFPTNPIGIYRYIHHLAIRQSENSLTTPDDALLENAEGFSITVPDSIDLSRPQLFGGPTSSAIIKIIGPNNQPQTIKALLKITPEDYLLREWEGMEVSCGEIAFSKTRRRKLESGEIEHYISPGICLTFDPNKVEQNFEVRYQSHLRYTLDDLLFMDALRKGKPILLNGEPTFEFKASRSRKLREFLEPLEYFQALNEMCGELGIDPKLCRIADLSESASNNLLDVCLCFSNKAVFNNEQGIPLRHELDLGAGKIQLLWVADEETGKWKPTSFFDTTKHVFAVTQEDPATKQKQLVPVTPYEFIPKGELGDVLNLHPELLVPAYEKLVGDFVLPHANDTVLSLITSADKTPHRRTELLKMALDLSNWTLQQDPDSPTYRINNFQIKKRLGIFTDDDQVIVQGLWNDARNHAYGEESLSIEVGSCILLGKFVGVDYQLENMGKTEQESFKTLPIYFLYQTQGEEYVLGSPNNDEDWSRVEKRILNEEFKEIAQATGHTPS